MLLSTLFTTALVGGAAQVQVIDLQSTTSSAPMAAAKKLQQDSVTLDLITDGAGMWTVGPLVCVCERARARTFVCVCVNCISTSFRAMSTVLDV